VGPTTNRVKHWLSRLSCPQCLESGQVVSIHVMNDPKPSLFFTALPLPCIIVNTIQRTKKQGRLATDSCFLLSVIDLIMITGGTSCDSSCFRCNNGEYIPSTLRCNGSTEECSDGSDERGCRKLSCQYRIVNLYSTLYGVPFVSKLCLLCLFI